MARGGQRLARKLKRAGAKTHHSAQPTARRLYSEEEKLKAVTAVLSVSRDHPSSYAAYDAACIAIGGKPSSGTLSLWVQRYGTQVLAALPQPTDAVTTITDTHASIVDDLVEIRSKMVNRLKDDAVVKLMSGRDTAVTLGITNDHLLKMTGLPVEAQARMKTFMIACGRANMDWQTAIDDYINLIERSIIQPVIDVNALPLPLPR